MTDPVVTIRRLPNSIYWDVIPATGHESSFVGLDLAAMSALAAVCRAGGRATVVFDDQNGIEPRRRASVQL